jgi:ribonuclease E
MSEHAGAEHAGSEHAGAQDDEHDEAEFEGGERAEAHGAETHGEGGQPGESGEPRDRGDGERRRRRRGRRGGRRNRRDREGEERFASDTQSPIEPELADAVADFGGPPLSHERSESTAPAAFEAPHEADTHRESPTATHETPAEPEPPRRRSTVREPVPSDDDGASPHVAPSATPAAEAAEPAHADESENKPRRTGWWAKRVLGG